MNDKRLFGVGAAGVCVSAVCCFTPLLAIVLGGLGLAAWLDWADYVLFPALAIFVAISLHGRLASMAEAAGMSETAIEYASTITCPRCGHRVREAMPVDACQFFYDCKGCGAVLRPEPGDCCVFCSYGSVPCPPVQAGDRCCD